MMDVVQVKQSKYDHKLEIVVAQFTSFPVLNKNWHKYLLVNVK